MPSGKSKGLALFIALWLFYLLLSLGFAAYRTQQTYQQFIDTSLNQASSAAWQDGAQLGEQAQTQQIVDLQSLCLHFDKRQFFIIKKVDVLKGTNFKTL